MARFKLEFKVGNSKLKVSEDTAEDTMDSMIEMVKEVTTRWTELGVLVDAGAEVLIDEAKKEFFNLIMEDIEKKVSEASYRSVSEIPVNDFISLWEVQLEAQDIEDPCGGGCIIEELETPRLEEMLHKIYQAWSLKKMVDTHD